MRALLRLGLPAASLLVVVLTLLLRQDAPNRSGTATVRRGLPEFRDSAPVPARAARDSAPRAAAAPSVSLEAILSGGVPSDVPAGVLSGPFTAKEGPGGEPDALKELSLTPSQKTVVEALVAERDGKLSEIRRQIDARIPGRDEADRYCVKATAAQETCVSSIRSTLLPDQQERFDRLLQSGRWGRGTLVIPVGR